MGKTKEVFDAELYGIKIALDITINRLFKNPYIKRLIVLSDSQAVLLRVFSDYLGPGQATVIDISVKAQTLIDKGIEVFLQWVPSHINIEGNERADKAAKEAADKPISPGTERYSFFSYIARKIKA